MPDYERAGNAARRGIESEVAVPGLIDEAVGVDRPAVKRGLFDGLKLGAGRPEEGRGRPEAGRETPDGLSRAMDRYARAWTNAARMRAQDLPILEHQNGALGDAGAALDAVRPGATRDLKASLEHEPATVRAMAKLQGRERATQLVAGIEYDEKVRRDPHLKAERLVKVWNKLESQHERMIPWSGSGRGPRPG